MSDKNNYSEDSRNFFFTEQNKKKKKKLEEEYGMTSMKTGDDASPEIINNFLSYVENFEEAWKNVETKKIREILNFPDFRKVEDIALESLEKEINNVLKLYNKHDYNIDIIEKDDVSDTDFYRFLTEELPEHETDFFKVPGMRTTFIYEEFHPNDKLDSKDSINQFLYGLKSKDEEDIKTWLSEEPLYYNGKSKSQPEFIKDVFSLIPQQVVESEIIFKKFETDKNKVYVDFIIWHKVNPENEKEEKITKSFLFILEKSEFGMFNIKSLEIIS